MARRPPESLAAALKANLKRRKLSTGSGAPDDPGHGPVSAAAKDREKMGEKPANPPPGPAKS